jgi:hypothetical protein
VFSILGAYLVIRYARLLPFNASRSESFSAGDKLRPQILGPFDSRYGKERGGKVRGTGPTRLKDTAEKG